LVIAGVGGLACAGCCGGILLAVFGALKSSPPYQMALEKVRQDKEVIQRLGEPIEEASMFPTGNINFQNDRGEATLSFSVAGPKGKAAVDVKARMVAGKWGLTSLDVTFEDGKRLAIDVGGGSLEGPDDSGEAPKWTPPGEEKPEAMPPEPPAPEPAPEPKEPTAI